MPATSNAQILKASAGSGKTFALAKTFIKQLILSPTEYHQLLALTFTNDAKNEMKSRILKELSSLAAQESSPFLTAITSDFTAEKIALNQAQIFHRSQLALTQILNDYSRFNVVTLDHFFTQLIRHLARELKLNLGYELDLDTAKALDEATYALFTHPDKRVRKWLRTYLFAKLDDDKGWKIEANIKSLGTKLFEDSFIDIKEVLSKNAAHLDDFVTQLKKQIITYEQQMAGLGQQALQLLKKHNLQLSDFRNNTVNVFERLAKQTFSFESDFSATFRNGSWYAQKCNIIDKIEACANDGLDELREKVLEWADNYRSTYIESKNLLKNIFAYGVLSVLYENLWDYRNTNNILLLSDTATILNGVISLSDTPFIYEKIGAKYKHILIDEFQDTSAHQWQNILPLLEFALFEGGRVLLVGDVKQSIYRWRGGDPSLLLQQAPADLAAHTPDVQSLASNYRSGKNIVRFNNAFFSTASSHLSEWVSHLETKQIDLNKAYADVVQEPTKDFDGYVKLSFFDNTEDVSWKQQSFKATKEAIVKAINDGFRPEDIMVLVRKNNQAREVATYLLSEHIPTLTDEALQLEKSPLVQFIMLSLQVLLEPINALLLAKRAFFEASLQGKPPVQALEQATPFDTRAYTGLDAYEAIEKLIREFQLHKQFDPFLQGIQDVCLEQAQKGHVSIAAFINQWQQLHSNEKHKPTIILGKNKGAVQVKTIHKSKGLQSPVVILPSIEGKIVRSHTIFWPSPLPKPYAKWGSLPLALTENLIETDFAPQFVEERFATVLEELNSLYVGFTRAMERLYIFVSNKKDKNTIQKIVGNTLAHASFSLGGFLKDQTFELGTCSPAIPKEDDDTNEKELTSYPTSDPAQKLAPASNSNFWKQLDNQPAQQLRTGNTLHYIMSQLHSVTPETLNEQLQQILNKMVWQGKLPAQERLPYKQKIETLFISLPQLYHWFAPGLQIINEHKIIAEGKVHIPDRVVLNQNNAIIIDFKKEVKAEEHRKQITLYAHLLTQMGYRVQQKYLVYIDSCEIVEV